MKKQKKVKWVVVTDSMIYEPVTSKRAYGIALSLNTRGVSGKVVKARLDKNGVPVKITYMEF